MKVRKSWPFGESHPARLLGELRQVVGDVVGDLEEHRHDLRLHLVAAVPGDRRLLAGGDPSAARDLLGRSADRVLTAV